MVVDGDTRDGGNNIVDAESSQPLYTLPVLVLTPITTAAVHTTSMNPPMTVSMSVFDNHIYPTTLHRKGNYDSPYYSVLSLSSIGRSFIP